MVKKREGPDQARSWAIVMAGCAINTLLSGITRTSGLFYVALIEDYGATRMEANMPFTLRNVVRNLGGEYFIKFVFITDSSACAGGMSFLNNTPLNLLKNLISKKLN